MDDLDDKGYPASAAANYFIVKSIREKQLLTMLKVIKIVYIAHGWCLGILNRKLVDENVEAWSYGPVIPTLYHALKHYSSKKIDNLIEEWDLFSDIPNIDYIPRSDTEINQVLDKVWEVYKDYSASQLIKLTHARGTPWSNTWDIHSRHRVIPNELIAEHYKELLERMVKRPSQAMASAIKSLPRLPDSSHG